MPRMGRKDLTSLRRSVGTGTRRTGKLLLGARTPLTRKALRHAVAPSSEHLALLRVLRPRTIIDVGANKGQFALAARLAGCAGEIYSFEPLPEPAATFRTIFAGDAQAHLVERAVSDAAGTAVLHESARADSSSLLAIGDRQVELFPGTAEVGSRAVNVGVLADELADLDLQAPTLLKIDVQGNELAVLRGAGTVLTRVEHVYVEVSFERLYSGQPLADQIVRYLFDRGYLLAEIGDVSFVRGRCIQADLLFSRTPSHDLTPRPGLDR